jgi:hypothetical protein
VFRYIIFNSLELKDYFKNDEPNKRDILKGFEQEKSLGSVISDLGEQLNIIDAFTCYMDDGYVYDNMFKISHPDNEFTYRTDVVKLVKQLDFLWGDFKLKLFEDHTTCNIYNNIDEMDNILACITTTSFLLKDILKLLDLINKPNIPYPLKITISKHDSDPNANKSLSILSEEQLLIHIKARLILTTTFLTSRRYESLSYDLLVYSLYEIHEVSKLNGHYLYGCIYNAFHILNMILSNTDSYSLLFNIFSFINSSLVYDDNSEKSQYLFSPDNNFEKTKDHLRDILPKYVLVFNSNKEETGKACLATTSPRNLIMLNTNGLGERQLKNILQCFLTFLHELFHIKRIISTNTYYTVTTPEKIKAQNSQSKEVGEFSEELLMVNFILIKGCENYDFLIYSTEISEKDIKYFLYENNWQGDLVCLKERINQIKPNKTKNPLPNQVDRVDKVKLNFEESTEAWPFHDKKTINSLADKYGYEHRVVEVALSILANINFDLEKKYSEKEIMSFQSKFFGILNQISFSYRFAENKLLVVRFSMKLLKDHIGERNVGFSFYNKSI